MLYLLHSVWMLAKLILLSKHFARGFLTYKSSRCSVTWTLKHLNIDYSFACLSKGLCLIHHRLAGSLIRQTIGILYLMEVQDLSMVIAAI